LVSETVTQGAVLGISEDMIDKNYAFKCVATNHYYGAMHDNASAIIFMVTTGNLTLSILNAILRPSFSLHSTFSAFEVFYKNALY